MHPAVPSASIARASRPTASPFSEYRLRMAAPIAAAKHTRV